MTLLFVCTGNTCRSPMAAALMEAELTKRGIPATVLSAGLAAEEGGATPEAVAALAEWGLDLSGHRATPLTPELAAEADLVCGMTGTHCRLLLAAGVDPEKVCLLGDGIPDPYGGDLPVYRRCRDAIAAAVADLAGRLEAAQ